MTVLGLLLGVMAVRGVLWWRKRTGSSDAWRREQPAVVGKTPAGHSTAPDAERQRYGLDALYSKAWVDLDKRFGRLPVKDRLEVAALAHLRPYLADQVAHDPDQRVRLAFASNPYLTDCPAIDVLLNDNDRAVRAAAASAYLMYVTRRSDALANLYRHLQRKRHDKTVPALRTKHLSRTWGDDVAPDPSTPGVQNERMSREEGDGDG